MFAQPAAHCLEFFVPLRTAAHTRHLTALAAMLVVAGTVAGCSGPPATGDAPASSDAPAAPAVTGLSVATGSVSGGTEVTITGTGLDTVSGVTFGANPASTVTAVSAKELHVTTPVAANFAVGPVDVAIVAGDAAAVPSGSTFEYTDVTPVDAQMTYLLTHWQNRNVDEYGSYGDNDCVNFTSQSLIARGWEQTADWNHTANSDGTHSYSSAWISSTSMKKYFTAHPELAVALTDDQRDQVVIGDIVQFDWDNSGDRDHTGVVSRIEGTGADRVISFAGHSLDSDYRSVDTAITTDHPGATAYYWHLVA
ncbi:MAG: hypothetical protein JWQ43_1134 [Glaciihabitans sp.]|nr:hypothetical protein [Glaciihabitans sp.]